MFTRFSGEKKKKGILPDMDLIVPLELFSNCVIGPHSRKEKKERVGERNEWTTIYRNTEGKENPQISDEESDDGTNRKNGYMLGDVLSISKNHPLPNEYDIAPNQRISTPQEQCEDTVSYNR